MDRKNIDRKEVYLDYNATTPLHPTVKRTLMDQLDAYGNGSSMHTFGRKAGQVIEEAREQVARLINAEEAEIVFTGGGSESNNTVLKLLLDDSFCERMFSGRKRKLITTVIEHPSVLETARYLEKRRVQVDYLHVDRFGFVDVDQLRSRLTDDTALVSIMMANNEIGTIQDIKTAAELAHRKGALFHTDAVQTAGKVPIDVRSLGVDFLSLSGHKFYGPKGIGALYVKNNLDIVPLIHGGHQEEGRRAGTLNTLGIVGLGKAAQLAREEMEEERKRVYGLKERLRAGIEEKIPDVRFNGHREHSLPGTLNVSFLGAEGESILLYLDFEGIAVSTGSACATGSLEPSYVILETTTDPEYAHGSIRFSLGRETTEEDIDYVLDKLPPIIEKLRRMSTLYSSGAGYTETPAV